MDKRELKKVLELQYGFLDQLVSQGTCDLEQVKAIEETETSTLHRKKIVNELVEKLTSNPADRKLILELLKMNNQHHVTEFIEHEGRRPDVTKFKRWPLDKIRKSRITQNMKVLVENLDPDSGLVREWCSKGCINHQQCRDIEQTLPQFKRNRKLLNFLLKRSVADYDLFVDCLKNNDQGHLAELLEISDEQEDAMPKRTSGNWKHELEHLVELNHGLLDDLMSGGLLEYNDLVEDIEEFEVKSSFLVQRGRLLDLMVKQSPTDIPQFLEALRTTGQEHVANVITRNGCRYASDDKLYKRWPLDSQYESRITRNFQQLTEMIGTCVFSTELNLAACINSLQKCDVDETLIEYDKARKLLVFLLQSSIANYEDFVECLKKTNQHLVAKVLEERVVVEVFDSTVSSSVAVQEQEIVRRRFRCVTKCVYDMSVIEIIEIMMNLMLVLTLTLAIGITLVRISGTVALVILVTTITYQRWSSSDASQEQEIVDRWNEVRDTNNSQTIDEIDAVLSEQVAPGVEIVDIQTGSVRCYLLCRTPTALITLYEKLEMKGSLNVTMQAIFNLLLGGEDTVQVKEIKGRLSASELKRRVEVFSKDLDDLQKTSHDTDVLLKRPLHHDPQLLLTFDQPPTSSGEPRPVSGLVMLDKYLYVVYCEYNKVEVFDCEDHFEKITDIEVKEIKSPRDMVGSSVTSQLFISEMISDVIWRVDLKTGVSDVFIKTGYKGAMLSLVENRLLFTSRDSLLMFDIFSGERIKEIPFTKVIKQYYVLHAIESNRDSFFVSHGTSSNNTVSEINYKGRVIRVSDNRQQLVCDRLALDSVGCLLVTDYKNRQVVLFDEHLKYERILIDIKQLDNVEPTRLNYNKNNNRLTVGLWNGHAKLFEY